MDDYLDAQDRLFTMGCTEAQVEEFFQNSVFSPPLDPTYGRRAGLVCAESALMSSHLIPNNPESRFRLSQPKPDRLYGYSSEPLGGAFTRPQLLAQTGLHPRNALFAEATTQGLVYPFFAVEFKAAGGTGGDLWVATNQCAGAASACLKAVDQLNSFLQKSGSKQRIDNVSYSMAMDNNTAHLFISWKEDDMSYCLQRVGCFLLSHPEHLKEFRNLVRNILKWGMDERLTQVKDALDVILEENRRKAAEDAKARRPLSDAESNDSKKHKSSSSRRNSNASDPGRD
jgi:hypothetical protein